MTPEEVKAIRDQRSRDIAYRIIAEMVCCDVYERTPDGRLAPEDRGHAVCLYGGWGARIAIEDLDETLEEVLDGFNRRKYPWPVAPYQRAENGL